MKGSNAFRGMLEVRFGLPSVILRGVALPFDKVLELTPIKTGVQYFIYFVFLRVVDKNQGWWWIRFLD